MLYHKLTKLNHCLRSKLFEANTINRLNQKGFFGKSLTEVYLKTIKWENTPKEKEVFKKLNQYRKDLFEDKRLINFEEIGFNTQRSVAEILEKASSPEIWTRFFYHLTKTSKAKNILEIGTNLGVSGQYFLQALHGKKHSKFISLEGVKVLCEIAEKQFKTLSDSGQFEIHQGLYDQTLMNIVNRDISFDIVFIDGNHQYDATLKYFELIKNNLSDKAWIIFDDINWSSGMRKVWTEICLKKDIVFSVNFFKLGIILFDSGSNRVSQEQYPLFISV